MPIWGGGKSLGTQGGGLDVPWSAASLDVAFLTFLVWLNRLVDSREGTGAKMERASLLSGKFLCPKGRRSFLSKLTCGLLSPGLGSMVEPDGMVGTGQTSSRCHLGTLCGSRVQHLQTIEFFLFVSLSPRSSLVFYPHFVL